MLFGILCYMLFVYSLPEIKYKLEIFPLHLPLTLTHIWSKMKKNIRSLNAIITNRRAVVWLTQKSIAQLLDVEHSKV